MPQDRRDYMREYQKNRREKLNAKLLCIELFGEDEHLILEMLHDHAELADTTIRDLVVAALKESLVKVPQRCHTNV